MVLLFLVKQIVFVVASVILARIFSHKYFPFCRDSCVVAVGRHFWFLLILCGGRCYSCYCVFFAFFEGVIFLYLQFADDEAMIT